MLPEHKKQFLTAVGFTGDEIAAVETTMSTLSKEAQGAGLRSKEVAQPETVAVTPTPQPEPQPQQPSVDAQMAQAQQIIVKAMEPFLAQFTAELASLKEAVSQLQQQQVSNTPAASLAAKSITQQPGDHVISGRGPTGPKENNADKEAAQAVNSVTGIPFLDNIIALNGQRSQVS